MDTYERIARFHIVSLHLLAQPEKPYHEYDAQQEREQLDKTILSLVDFYEDNKDRVQSANEAEFRAYQILFQIQTPKPNLEDRVQSWPQRITQDPRVQSALRIYSAACSIANPQGPLKPYASHKVAQGHWASFWNLVNSAEVSYLMGCVAEIYFTKVRREALDSLWQAYRPRGTRAPSSDWTLAELRSVLGLETEDEVADYCEKVGFTMKENDNGTACLDLGSAPGGPSNTIASQLCSNMVGNKRHGRKLPAVMNGMNVWQARDAGLLEKTDKREGLEAQQGPGSNTKSKNSSLFVTADSDLEREPQQRRASAGAPPVFNAKANPFQSPTFNANAAPNSTWSPSNGIKFGDSENKSPFSTAATPQDSSSFQYKPAQPTFAPPSTSTPNPFGFTPTPAPAQEQATNVPNNGNLNGPSLFDRVSKPTDNASPQSSAPQPFQFGSPVSSTTPFAAQPTMPTTNQSAPHSFFASNQFQPPTPQGTFHQQASPSSTPQAQPKFDLFAPKAPTQQPSPFVPPLQNTTQTQLQQSQTPAQSFPTSSASSEEILAKAAALEKAKVEHRKRTEEEASRRREAEIREAEEQERRAQALVAQIAAERKAQRAKTLDELARRLLVGPYGFLEQYIEYTARPLIKATQEQVKKQRLTQEADDFRLEKIMCRYGRKWRDMCWKRRLAKQARERRKKQQRDAQARVKREQEKSISTEMEAFRQSMGHSQSSMTSSEGRFATAEPSSTNRLNDQVSVSDRQPQKERGRDLASPQLDSSLIDFNPRRPTPPEQSAAPSGQLSESQSRRSSLGTSRWPDQRASRRDTTRSNYFRLKAMGIEPPRSILPPAKPASEYQAYRSGKKRVRESDSYADLRGAAGASANQESSSAENARSSMPPPSKRPASQVEVEKNLNESTSTASSFNLQDEDEALFEAVRQAKKAMSDSVDFFKEEMEGMKRESERSSRSTSVNGNSTGAASDSVPRYQSARERYKIDELFASVGSEDSVSRREVAPPPKYRSRVSKFLPREEYADVKMQRALDDAAANSTHLAPPPTYTPRRHRQPEEVHRETKGHANSTPQHEEAITQSEAAPNQHQGSRMSLPSALAASQSQAADQAYRPGASLSTLIQHSTHHPNLDSSRNFVPASASLTSTTQQGIPHSHAPKNTSAFTSFVSESSNVQPASSSFGRPATPQFAPATPSPLPTPKAPTPNQHTTQKPTTTIPSSSPGPETGTQQHDRLGSLAAPAAAGMKTKATPISPPKLKRRSTDLGDEDDPRHNGHAGRQSLQTQTQTQKPRESSFTPRKRRLQKRDPSLNTYALLAEPNGEDESASEEHGADGMDRDEGEAQRNGESANPVDDLFHDRETSSLGFDNGDIVDNNDDGNNWAFTGDVNGDVNGNRDPIGGYALGYGQGNDYATEEDDVDGEYPYDDDHEQDAHTRYIRADEDDGIEDGEDLEGEEEFEENEEGEEQEEGDEDVIRDEYEDEESDESEEDAQTRQNQKDYGGKTGASVEDAIEL